MEVSVIIPARNEENYIIPTLESVSKNLQGIAGETIVVCDSCTDKTVELVKGYHDIKLFTIDARKPGVAKNTGATYAHGKYLIFLDADTLLSSSAVKDIVSCLRQEEAFGSLWVKPNPATVAARFIMLWKNLAFTTGMYPGTNGIIFCTRSLFDKVAGFDSSLYSREDGDFSSKASNAAPYRYIRSSHVITSMRRFQQKGYLSVITYWIQVYIKHMLGKKDGEYEVVR